MAAAPDSDGPIAMKKVYRRLERLLGKRTGPERIFRQAGVTGPDCERQCRSMPVPIKATATIVPRRESRETSLQLPAARRVRR